MELIRRPLATLRESRRPYLILNAVTFGLFAAGLVVGTFWPEASRRADAMVGSLAGMSPASDSAFAAMHGGQVALLAGIILSANVLIGGLLMAILPSLIVPFAGIAIHVAFAGSLGLMFAPWDGWSVLVPHLPTTIIELAAYVLFMLGVYRHGTNFLRPRSRGLHSRMAGYRQGLTDLGWLCVPAFLLLVVGAVYEAFEVIVLLG